MALVSLIEPALQTDRFNLSDSILDLVNIRADLVKFCTSRLRGPTTSSILFEIIKSKLLEFCRERQVEHGWGRVNSSDWVFCCKQPCTCKVCKLCIGPPTSLSHIVIDAGKYKRSKVCFCWLWQLTLRAIVVALWPINVGAFSEMMGVIQTFGNRLANIFSRTVGPIFLLDDKLIEAPVNNRDTVPFGRIFWKLRVNVTVYLFFMDVKRIKLLPWVFI